MRLPLIATLLVGTATAESSYARGLRFPESVAGEYDLIFPDSADGRRLCGGGGGGSDAVSPEQCALEASAEKSGTAFVCADRADGTEVTNWPLAASLPPGPRALGARRAAPLRPARADASSSDYISLRLEGRTDVEDFSD